MNRSLASGSHPALPERRVDQPLRPVEAVPVPVLDPRVADNDEDAPNLLGY